LHTLAADTKKNGLSLQSLENKMDRLFLMMEQLENKVMCRTSDLIDHQLSECREKLLYEEKEMIMINESVIHPNGPASTQQEEAAGEHMLKHRFHALPS
jgi:hypothetical protein